MRVLPITNYNYRNNYVNMNAKPSFGAYLNKNLFEKVKQERFDNKEYLTPNIDGDLPMHLADVEKMKKMHRVLPLDVMLQIHRTPNKDGNLPIHLAGLQETQEIHRAWKDYPKVIVRIHTTPNNKGDLPMHLANEEKAQEILRALEDRPHIIAKILLTPNKDGRLPGSCWKFDEREEILQTIYNIATNSDVDLEPSIKLLESYNPNSEYDDAIETLKRHLESDILLHEGKIWCPLI